MDTNLLKELFECRDGVLIRKKRTASSVRIGDVAGHVRKDGYITVSVNNKHEYVHRIVFAMHHGYAPDYVDHINGNPSDNRIENLREATFAQNVWNTGLRTSNKSGVKGVSMCKDTGKWACRFWENGKPVWLGRFETVESAKAAIEKERSIRHGEFARSN